MITSRDHIDQIERNRIIFLIAFEFQQDAFLINNRGFLVWCAFSFHFGHVYCVDSGFVPVHWQKKKLEIHHSGIKIDIKQNIQVQEHAYVFQEWCRLRNPCKTSRKTCLIVAGILCQCHFRVYFMQHAIYCRDGWSWKSGDCTIPSHLWTN